MQSDCLRNRLKAEDPSPQTRVSDHASCIQYFADGYSNYILWVTKYTTTHRMSITCYNKT